MTAPQWAADLHVDAVLATELIREQFADLEVRSVSPFGNGWDNTAFLVNESLIVRFPRRAQFAHLIETEAAILPLIAGALPLAVSEPTHVGGPSERYPYTFAGYPLVSGCTAITLALSDAQRIALAMPLARFLRALHDIDVAPLVSHGLPADTLGRLDHAKRWPLAQARFAQLAASGEVSNAGLFLDWMGTHPPQPPERSALRVVHGDLYAQHVVLDDALMPAGVIDWGDMHLGDVALDLAVAHLMLPAAAYPKFRAAYGPIDDRTWTAARYRAIYHASIELEYGLAENDTVMRDAGRLALQMIGPELERT